MFQNKTIFIGIITRMIIKSEFLKSLALAYSWSFLSGYMIFNLISYRVQLEFWISLFGLLFCLINFYISMNKLWKRG